MRFATTVACAFVAWSAAAPAQDAPQAAPESPPGASPRELLAAVGLDASFFDRFADDRPLDASEREKLDLLLYRLRRIPPATMKEFEQPPRAISEMAANPAESRGDVVLVAGYVRQVVREQLPPEARKKFEFDAVYRCQMVTFAGGPLILYALSVPRAWRLDEPIDERASAAAMFVKRLPSSADHDPAAPDRPHPFGVPSIKGSPLLAAVRVAWHPATLLGDLGMDVGLLDEVRDRADLERECFYQLLGAVARAPAGRIESAGRENLAKSLGLLERMVRNRELGPKGRAAAEHALERAQQGADDVVPLFNEPAAQRGKLLVLIGEALRAVEIRVDDPAIAKRFGIDHYYEVEIVTPDSQNNPIVCCVAELPRGMPLGQAIHEHVRVTGFFLKSWAFDTPQAAEGSARRQQLAPLVIAKTVEVLATPAAPPQGAAFAVLLVAALVIGGAVAWYVRRGDRRAMAQAAAAPDAPPGAPEGWDDASRPRA
jgi:hypothetical protein